MKRDLFIAIDKYFEEKIMEMQVKGTDIDQLTSQVNRKLCESRNTNFTLIDWKFSQLVLINFQAEGKIYKTSDKLIFPNIRF
jgi:hypothetical protein